MFEHTYAFSGFSVDDLAAAKHFYGDVLGLRVSEQHGMLTLQIEGGHNILVYQKPDHEPATFTILNFPVDDLEAAVRELTERGVEFERTEWSDELGINHSPADQDGPDIAWFKDPAGNFLAVLAG
ncbi:VOC family protein [Lysinibacter cavernae]|uniref:Catechol 2,3-dioxygenase-like lactoylglutathione lyase family enzyme n=1 Tax=Lysinibacter cavernae TaxID=1640652 RepID=A0A7X5R0C7_9MICO|nr:VOC family protein [Lysinibacter cavernae]NIH53172.1 catechol 2,3-dioxygenase-like lactoylglutathione lyase family enzyme [Lysinibacter cavernae]